MAEAPRRRWRSVLAVVAAALLVVVAADLAAQRIAILPPALVEAEDALALYRRSDPDTLVLGSSHARSFAPMRDLVADRTGGRVRLLTLPLEAGKMSSYQWLLEHKVRPIIEERDRSGGLVRKNLARVLLVTEYWDACEPGVPWYNLPARAWGWSDFLGDVARNGLTDYNRNFLRERWRHGLPESLLVQDRGHYRISRAVRDGLRPRAPGDGPTELEESIGEWRTLMEDLATCPDAAEKRALTAMLDYLQGRGLEVTLVLFPRMPAVITEKAKQTTLKKFFDYTQGLARTRGLRVVDLTFATPLVDSDFQADIDHLSPAGNRKLAAWGLEHDLRFLLDPPAPARDPGAMQVGGVGPGRF